VRVEWHVRGTCEHDGALWQNGCRMTLATQSKIAGTEFRNHEAMARIWPYGPASEPRESGFVPSHRLSRPHRTFLNGFCDIISSALVQIVGALAPHRPIAKNRAPARRLSMPDLTEWKVPFAFQPRAGDYRFDLDRNHSARCLQRRHAGHRARRQRCLDR
jgi:hypothetical protein